MIIPEIGEDSLAPEILLISPTTDSLIKSSSRSSLAPSYSLNLLAGAFLQLGKKAIVHDEFSFKNDPSMCQFSGWLEAVQGILDLYPSIKIVGISVLTNFRKEAAIISKYIRENKPEILIIWGGPHVTALGIDLFEKFKLICDVMVCGPADWTTLKSIIEISQKPLSERKAEYFFGNFLEDIALTVLPDYRQSRIYSGGTLPKLILRTSSGCPTPGCIFCSALKMEGRYSKIGTDQVNRQILNAVSFKPKRIEFHDQDLLYSFSDIQKSLSAKDFVGIDTIYCHSGMDSISAQDIEFMKNFPVNWEIFIGLESASPKLYHRICKRRLGGESLDHLLEMTKRTQNSNVRIGLFVMFGIPGEDDDDTRITLEFLRKAGDVELACNIMKVFPGTIIAKELIQKGVLSNDLWLDENGPRVVSAVNGLELDLARERWRMVQKLFPKSRNHNSIDRSLFEIEAE